MIRVEWIGIGIFNNDIFGLSVKGDDTLIVLDLTDRLSPDFKKVRFELNNSHLSFMFR